MSLPERVLVIGATGLIGNALVRSWERRGVPVLGADRRCRPGGPFIPLDFTQEGRLAAVLREFKPTVVAVPAANPHVDFCETYPEETATVNVAAPAAAARLCAESGAVMVFYSSDYVFDGARGPYAEDDPVCPVNEYGRQKVAAEKAVLEEGRHLVIRSSGVYGWQWAPKNFVLQVLAALSHGQRLKVPHDIRYNPTSAENLAEVTAGLCAGKAAGIFHVVGADRLPRFGFSQEIARMFGLDESLLEPVGYAPSGDLATQAPGDPKRPSGVTPGTAGGGILPAAPRPKESSLATDKVRAFLSAPGVLGADVPPPLRTGSGLSAPLWGVRDGLSDMLARRSAWEEYAKTSLPTAGSI
ncbi:MAG: SDR family oxidoreductase [Elusimicrobia bacterium]|nr:SDR family oxidoreductase [Elusimicrobiota bacterium]